jgi:hypothetical protein
MLALLPRDMAKIGYLYLRHGQWEGKQLLPLGWADVLSHALVNVHASDDPNQRYSNFMWVFPDNHAFMASGLHGQLITVFPDLLQAIRNGLRTGGFKGRLHASLARRRGKGGRYTKHAKRQQCRDRSEQTSRRDHAMVPQPFVVATTNPQSWTCGQGSSCDYEPTFLRTAGPRIRGPRLLKNNLTCREPHANDRAAKRSGSREPVTCHFLSRHGRKLNGTSTDRQYVAALTFRPPGSENRPNRQLTHRV